MTYFSQFWFFCSFLTFFHIEFDTRNIFKSQKLHSFVDWLYGIEINGLKWWRRHMCEKKSPRKKNTEIMFLLRFIPNIAKLLLVLHHFFSFLIYLYSLLFCWCFFFLSIFCCFKMSVWLMLHPNETASASKVPFDSHEAEK